MHATSGGLACHDALRGGGVAAADERASAWGYDTGFGRVPRAAHHGRHREVAPDRRTETTIPLDTSRHTAERAGRRGEHGLRGGERRGTRCREREGSHAHAYDVCSA